MEVVNSRCHRFCVLKIMKTLWLECRILYVNIYWRVRVTGRWFYITCRYSIALHIEKFTTEMNT